MIAPSTSCSLDRGIGSRIAATHAAFAALLLLLPTIARTQDTASAVSGIVIGAGSLRPVEGAQVTARGADRTTTTNTLGRFTIAGLLGPSVVLEVRRVGYRPLTQEVPVGNGRIELRLVETAVELDAIVITGTPGGSAARAIGNAVGTFAAGDVLEQAPAVEIQQLLNARVPGLVQLSAQGNVGTGGLTLIRGVSSLSLTNEPLLYIDGVRVDNNPRAGPNIRNGRQVARINDLNPEEIEAVEVIKGPAAATIYGTEASRGVIQVFTRQGREGPPRFAVTIKHGANWFMNPAGRLPWVFGYDMTGPLDPITNRYPLDSVHLYLQEQAAGRPIFRTGHVQSYELNISGGAQGVRYYLSGGFDGDDGIVSYNWRRRYSTRANLTLLPSAKLEVVTSLGFVHNTARLAQAVNTFGLMEQIDWGDPSTPRDTSLRSFLRATPEAAASVDSRFAIDRFVGSVRLKHQPFPWLTQRLTVGGDVGDETSSTLFPRYPEGTRCFFEDFCLGDKTVDQRLVRYGTLDYSINAAARLHASLRSISSLGAQYYVKDVTTGQVLCREFPDPGVTTCSGAAESTGSEDRLQNKTLGVFVQQQLDWKNRVFITGAVRADDNSAFGVNFDFVTYPKIAGTWVVSEEPFWPTRWVNTLKLRAAWGRAGQQPDAFAAERSYLPVPGGTVTPLNAGNPDLKPEQSEELELGFDAGLWNDRVAIGYTHYARRTIDAIVARPVAPSDGFPGTMLDNIGAVHGWGNELSLDARVLQHPRVAWDLGLSLSNNDNRIERLGNDIVLRGNLVHREGYPVASFFQRVIESATRDASGNWTILCNDGPGRPPVTCASAPRVYDGRTTPTWQGSVRTSLNLFGRLRLYGLIDFKSGFVIDHGALGGMSGVFHNSRSFNDSSDVMLLAQQELARLLVGNVRVLGYLNGGFAKLRELSATYTLPPVIASRLGAERATITVAGRNLAILWMAQREVWGVNVLDPEQRFGDEVSELDSFVRAALPQYAQVLMTIRLTL